MRSLAWSLLFIGIAFGQEFRATISGRAIDQSSSAIPGLSIRAINTQTNMVSQTTSGADGSYAIPFLAPGVYRLDASAAGFKSFVQYPVELRINDKPAIDIRMEVGSLTESVQVNAQVQLLETNGALRGQLIENRVISTLPLNGHNPFTLMKIASGVQYTGSLIYSRPFDNGAIADFSINGGRSGVNEFQLDGAPNNANTGRNNIAYVPRVEATQEFKVITNSYDAQYGRTGGGIVNVSLKSGTNSPHGALYEYNRNTVFEANQFSNNAAGQPRTPHRVNQYGFELDGPVYVPKIFNGRDRSFFMFSWEGYKESTPQPRYDSFPTALMRGGDFSRNFNANGSLQTIYDPLTTRSNGQGGFVRDPFPGNVIPKGRILPISTRILQDLPLPVLPGDRFTGLNNWYAAQAAEVTDFNNYVGRYDHTISSKLRMYVRGNYNNRDGGRINYTDIPGPASQQIHAGRRNYGAVADAVYILNPATLLNLRYGFTRFRQLSVEDQYDPRQLGFKGAWIDQTPHLRYPWIQWEQYTRLSQNPWDLIASDTHSYQGNLTLIRQSHSIKAGAELRLMRQPNELRPASRDGRFEFTRNFTRANPVTADTVSGNAIASFLLGATDTGYVDKQPANYFSWRYPAMFVQDDWKVTRRVTINAGLRWDYEAPVIERFNRMNRGFDFTSRSPLTVPGLDLRGGLLFAGVNAQPRGAFEPDRSNWQPRAGVAWKISDRHPIVFRAGVGKYYLPTVENGGVLGFSQRTPMVTQTSDYRPINLLDNPFPDGLLAAPGASLGLLSQVGQGISYADPTRRIPYVWQYSAGFEYEIVGGILLEASYSASQSRRLQVSDRNVNVLTLDQLALGQAVLTRNIDNPFFDYVPAGNPLKVRTIQAQRLLTPYPQFGGITDRFTSEGSSWYNALQIRAEKRFAHGFQMLLSYTISKTMEAIALRNAQDTQLSRELADFDRPRRLVVSGIYEFPLGRGKRYLQHGVLGQIAGNWETSWSFTAQSGAPTPMPGGQIFGEPKLAHPSFDAWFNNSVRTPANPDGVWAVTPPFQLRTTGFRFPDIRSHSAPQLDCGLTRKFPIGERIKVELRAQAFNALNTPIFGNPDTSITSGRFGRVTLTQINLPRNLELGLRLSF